MYAPATIVLLWTTKKYFGSYGRGRGDANDVLPTGMPVSFLCISPTMYAVIIFSSDYRLPI